MPNYCGTLGAEAFSNETFENCWGGGLNQEDQETGGRFPAHPPQALRSHVLLFWVIALGHQGPSWQAGEV